MRKQTKITWSQKELVEVDMLCPYCDEDLAYDGYEELFACANCGFEISDEELLDVN